MKDSVIFEKQEQPYAVPQDPQEEAREEVEFNMPIGDTGERLGEGKDEPAPDSGAFPPKPDPSDSSQELRAANERYVRLFADFENYKKRFQRELNRQRDLERERFLGETLAIADNLRRAIKIDKNESSPYREGLLSVLRQIDHLLTGFGVVEIAALKGELMDANFHEAITALNIPGAPHESIIEVVEPGYTMGERVLRPTKVVVAKTED